MHLIAGVFRGPGILMELTDGLMDCQIALSQQHFEWMHHHYQRRAECVCVKSSRNGRNTGEKFVVEKCKFRLKGEFLHRTCSNQSVFHELMQQKFSNNVNNKIFEKCKEVKK